MELQQTLALIEQLYKTLAPEAPASTSNEPGKPPDTTPSKPRSRSGPTERLALEHVEQIFELDDADKTCPSCGGELRPMAGQFESSEMIDVVEIRYRAVPVKQQKYACRCGGCIDTAPGPERVIPGGCYEPRALALVRPGERRRVTTERHRGNDGRSRSAREAT